MKTRNILSLVLFCLLSVALFPTTCLAYQITNSELNRLETIFNQLEKNNLEQDKRLQKASELLLKSEQQINILQGKLTLAENSINQAQSSLQKANQSLDKYEKETKSEIRSLRFQRDVMIVGLLYMAFKK